MISKLINSLKHNNHLKLTRRASAPHNLGRRYILFRISENLIKSLLIAIIVAAATFQVSAYNKGLSCITFLSKNGSLEINESEKFKESDLEALLDYIENRFNVSRPKIVHENPSLYARGLGLDTNMYPRIKIIKEDLFYQNGIFYYERAQDTSTGMMEQYSKVIGGIVGIKCQKQEE